MMILLHFLRDIPNDRDRSKNYYIEYTILEHRVKYKLPLHSDSPTTISLNKIKVCYFFTHGRKGIN